MKQTIFVTGATGAQGSSVVSALLAENKFKVRAITRKPYSEKALQLKAAGAELIQADLNDVESLKQAMKGCYGVYGVTNFWEHFDKEYQQGINLIDAVKDSNIQHFVFHTLPSYTKLSSGKYPTPHCDIKAALQDYCQSLAVPATFVHIAFYYENFFNFFPPQPLEDGSFAFGFPQGDTNLAMVCIDDLGGVVCSLFNHPREYIGRTVGVVGADDTCSAYATTMSEVLGVSVHYNYIPRDIYAAFNFPGAEELANMFEVQRQYIKERQVDLIESYALNPLMQSFKSWVKNNKTRFEQIFTSGAAL